MSTHSLPIDDPSLLAALLGTGGDTVATPSSEMVDELDTVR